MNKKQIRRNYPPREEEGTIHMLQFNIVIHNFISTAPQLQV